MLRRLLAITMFLAFVFPLAAPLFATSTDSDSNLPACCRRHGKHHCAMLAGMMASTSGRSEFQAQPCSSYPTPATLPIALAAVFGAPHRIEFRARPDATVVIAHTSRAQSRAATAHLTRGPPVRTL